MSSSAYSLMFFPKTITSCVTDLRLELIGCAVVAIAVFGFWLAPGGLAWALSRPQTKANANTNTIPGPSGLPLTGLLYAFTGPTAHRVLAKLARAFHAVPLMAFSIGFTRFVISSHPDTAKDILNSSAFADRPVKESAYELLFHRAMGFAPFGEYWRNLRRISSTYLFSPKRISGFGSFRSEIGARMVEEIKVSMGSRGVVEVKRVLHFGSLSNVMMTVFGKSYDFSKDSDGCGELEELVSEGYDLLGVCNWSDHFPLLGWLDLQGVRRRCRCLVGKVNVFVGKIIEEHRMKRKANDVGESSVSDFVDVLLDLEKEESLAKSDMIAVLWVSFYICIYCF